jgi:hypothetical protein
LTLCPGGAAVCFCCETPLGKTGGPLTNKAGRRDSALNSRPYQVFLAAAEREQGARTFAATPLFPAAAIRRRSLG